jgi:NAD(P)-dependent dehydrogenase (short-subunit alcohol dehydrogenase family)
MLRVDVILKMSNLTQAKTLSGKTALITGASKGLGKAMALALSAAGASVALVSRDATKLSAVQAEIQNAGAKAEFFVADVGSEAQVDQLEKEVSAKVGKVQILINNAGINVRKNLTDFTLEEWQSVINPNVATICAAHARDWVRAYSLYDIDYESRFTPAAECVFGQQSGGAWFDSSLGVGTGAGRHHGEWHQPRAVRDGDEPADCEQPGTEYSVCGEHSGGALGKGRGHWQLGRFSLLRRGFVYHGDGHSN